MSFKDYFFKKLIPNYFMIVTFITIGMALSGILIYGNIQIGILTLFVPPAFGLIGCLPLLLDYVFLNKRSSGLWMFLYNAAELLMLEVCILTAGYFLGMINTLLSAVMMAALVFSIFAVVGGIMYIQDRKFCDSFNDALAAYTEKK